MARSANGHVNYQYLLPEALNNMQGQATHIVTVVDRSLSNEYLNTMAYLPVARLWDTARASRYRAHSTIISWDATDRAHISATSIWLAI